MQMGSPQSKLLIFESQDVEMTDASQAPVSLIDIAVGTGSRP